MSTLNICGVLPKLGFESLAEYFEKHPCPESVTKLHCQWNKLKTLKGCPQRITELSCDGNELTNFIGCPESVRELSAFRNNITSFEGCPKNVILLQLTENKFTTLNGCPENVKILDISSNKNLKSLKGLPIGLEKLSLSFVDNLEELGVDPELIKKLGFQIKYIYKDILKNNPAFLSEIPIPERTPELYIIAVCNGYPFEDLPDDYKNIDFCLKLIENDCKLEKIPDRFKNRKLYQYYSKKYETLKIPRKFIDIKLCVAVCSEKDTELVNVPMYLRTNKVVKAALEAAHTRGYFDGR